MGKIPNKNIKEKGLIYKSDISGSIDNFKLDKKIAAVAKTAELKA